VGISIIDKEHRKFIDIINKAIIAKEHNDNPEEIRKELMEVIEEMTEYALVFQQSRRFHNTQIYIPSVDGYAFH